MKEQVIFHYIDQKDRIHQIDGAYDFESISHNMHITLNNGVNGVKHLTDAIEVLRSAYKYLPFIEGRHPNKNNMAVMNSENITEKSVLCIYVTP